MKSSYLHKYTNKSTVVVSYFTLLGVPIGGIGAGTIGRGWQGDFNRWQLAPGVYSHDIVEINQVSSLIKKEQVFLSYM